MKNLRALLSVVAIALPLASAEPPAWRLDPKVAPVHQDVELRLDPADEGYEGTTRIHLSVSQPVHSFRLHAEEMEIRSLALERNGEPVPVTFEQRDRAILHVVTDQLLVPGDEYLLTIGFENEYDRRAVGLYKVVHGGEPYLFTQFQAVDARKAFPTWDEPGFKHPFQLTLVVPGSLDAVTNTPVEAVQAAGEAKRIRFGPTRPIPSYLIAIAVGDFEFRPIEGMGAPGSIVTVAGRSGLTGIAAEEIPRVLAEMERYFGSRYPWGKLDFIAIPEFWPGAMEHPGAITFAENFLLLDESRSSLSQRRLQSKVIAHELAHQWFGNLVTMKWWDDLWLSESFADWVGDEVASRVHPSWQIHESELQGIQRIMSSDARPTAEPIRRGTVEDPESVLGTVGLAYNKGKAVFEMFERWIGEERFRQGILRYLEANAWKNAEASDLWKALAAEGTEDLPAALETFLVQPGFPMIRVAKEPEGRVRLTQEPFRLAGTAPVQRFWRVPVGVRFSSGGESRARTVLLDETSKVFELAADEIEWVFPQADAVGYYRWSLPPEAMIDLAAHAAERLNPAERIAFLGNAAALLDAAEIRGDVFLQLVEQFAADPDPLVLSAALAQIERIEMPFVTARVRDDFASWVRETLGPALERIGLEPRPGEPESLAPVRAQLLGWLGDAGEDPDVLAWARAAASRYANEPAAVDPALAPTALQLAAKQGDEAWWKRMRMLYESAETPVDRGRYLDALGWFDDPALREATLNYALSGPVAPDEILQLAFATADDEAGRARLVEWTIDNWDAITRRIPPHGLAYLPHVARGCDEDLVARARELFTDPARRTEAAAMQLARVEDQVGECAALRAREGERVRKFLER